MKSDPVLSEIRQAREAYAEKFAGDDDTVSAGVRQSAMAFFIEHASEPVHAALEKIVTILEAGSAAA